MAGALFRELAEIVRLQKGRHRGPQDGVCAMELVAWMAGEKHSDHPRSASPVIAAFSRSFNDALGPAQRQRLAALTARMVGSRGTREQEVARAQALWDWMVTVAVPTWLAAAGRPEIADAVARGRGAALPSAIVALDAHGHLPVRPLNDRRVAADISRALAVAGLEGACLAARDVADGASGGRARRNWDAARTLARAAAWTVAENGGVIDEFGQPPLWRTAHCLRDSAFTTLDQLLAITEPAPPPPPAWAMPATIVPAFGVPDTAPARLEVG